jgi:hypothetical protein
MASLSIGKTRRQVSHEDAKKPETCNLVASLRLQSSFF